MITIHNMIILEKTMMASLVIWNRNDKIKKELSNPPWLFFTFHMKKYNHEWITLHEWDQIIDDISWMNSISFLDLMNFHDGVPLRWLQMNMIHKNGYKENMKFEFEIFQFALNMFKS
jgi:hypothetical protein